MNFPKRLVGIKRYITNFTDLIREVNNIRILILKDDRIAVILAYGKVTQTCIISIKRDISGSAYRNCFVLRAVIIIPTEKFVIIDLRVVQI